MRTVHYAVPIAVVLGITLLFCEYAAIRISKDAAQPTMAFISNRTGTKQLYLQDRLTGNLLQITAGLYDNSQPVWGHEGQLMYVSYPAPLHISVVDFQKSQTQIVKTGSPYHEYEPDLSPEGIVAVATNPNLNWDIALYDLRDGSHPAVPINSLDNELEPCWWDEDHLIFVSNRNGDSDIYVYDFESTALTNLTDYPADDYNPACSQHGLLAFTSTRDFNAEIYVMDLGTGEARNVTSHSAADFNPAWTHDGQLSFVSDRDGNREIYILELNTGIFQNMTHHPADDEQPAWSR